MAFVRPLKSITEQYYPSATLARTSNGSFQPVLDAQPARPVPWVASPDLPPEVTPIVITIKEGETLYLPAGWWHRVEQKEGPEGIAVALN
jgi:jumonji domain-containing protein 7